MCLRGSGPSNGGRSSYIYVRASTTSITPERFPTQGKVGRGRGGTAACLITVRTPAARETNAEEEVVRVLVASTASTQWSPSRGEKAVAAVPWRLLAFRPSDFVEATVPFQAPLRSLVCVRVCVQRGKRNVSKKSSGACCALISQARELPPVRSPTCTSQRTHNRPSRMVRS